MCPPTQYICPVQKMLFNLLNKQAGGWAVPSSGPSWFGLVWFVCVETKKIWPPQKKFGGKNKFQTPSRHLPDTFQTLSGHPPLQTPCRHSPDTLQPPTPLNLANDNPVNHCDFQKVSLANKNHLGIPSKLDTLGTYMKKWVHSWVHVTCCNCLFHFTLFLFLTALKQQNSKVKTDSQKMSIVIYAGVSLNMYK